MMNGSLIGAGWYHCKDCGKPIPPHEVKEHEEKGHDVRPSLPTSPEND